MSKHVAVLMGGWSAERDISLRSGRACADALTRLGYRVTRIDVGRDIAAVLGTVKPDTALNLLHGRPGEDGTLQGTPGDRRYPLQPLRRARLRAGDAKDMAKAVFRAAGVPVPEGIVASRAEVAKSHLLPPPYVIKPLAEGSSVGVFIVTAEHAHPPQELTREDWAWRPPHRRKVYCRQGVGLCGDGRRGARRNRGRAGGPLYDYEAGYAPGGSRHVLPAPVLAPCLSTSPRTGVGGASGARLPGRKQGRLRYDDTIEGPGDWSF